MSKNRIQYTDDFVLKNEKVGINTSDPQETLHVDGNIRSDNSNFTGDATLNEFSGFQQDIQKISDDTTLTDTTRGSYNSTSSELVIEDGVELTVSDDVEVSLGRVETLTVNNNLKVPSSGSEDREDTPEKGSTRFNQDLGQLEFYTGYEWRTVNSYADSGGRGRGVFGGGNPMNGLTQVIDFITISTLGNAQDFGEMYTYRRHGSGMSSSVRGLFGGGAAPAPSTNTNVVDYITIASKGNPIDFGDLSLARRNPTGTSSSNRGLTAGGYTTGPDDTVDYVEISTLGNALDFGNLSVESYYPSGSSSPIRGVFAGGISPTRNIIEISSVVFSSKGNAIEFGNLVSGGGQGQQGCSNSIRGVFNGFGGSTSSKIIEFVTFSSLGNSIEFGSLTDSKITTSVSSQTRAVFSGGVISPIHINTIEYISISTGGNAQDFGDLTYPRNGMFSVSDSHGGLGGF